MAKLRIWIFNYVLCSAKRFSLRLPETRPWTSWLATFIVEGKEVGVSYVYALSCIFPKQLLAYDH